MDNVEKGTQITVTAKKDGVEAELKLEYVWLESGKFLVSTISYRTYDNKRSKGNIKVGLVSKDDTGWVELTKKGIQDGKWHAFNAQVSVEGNGESADIHFNWVYDQQWPRPEINMTGMETVRHPSAGATPPGDISE
ncbi:hypothetical protein BK654_27565 [Pseudomonas brassicacearum]|uniref:hypothetical protein n=1 Tax=Pseudomonas brassicacearum TaxID=930166 RepID=UPI000F4682B8|nr:hypothetical protein [Pseudomonas brassicacearum]ROM72410.1 hypothetical protein BK654_27565 [Pseudomonas brassicacearum]